MVKGGTFDLPRSIHQFQSQESQDIEGIFQEFCKEFNTNVSVKL